MASKDIEKLKEKFDKDPNSKLFLPLAEEYRKEGLLEEAAEVLQHGLEKHPTYTSARVLLGKIYLEKGMMEEARREFEGVIKTIPDNLFAHKKLAEIYRDTGETDLAIKSFKTILKLNPMDEETINDLRNVEAAVSPAQASPEQKGPDSKDMRLKITEETAHEEAEAHLGEEISIAEPDVKVEHSEEELNAFKDFLFGDKAGLGDEISADAGVLAEPEEEAVEKAEVAGAETPGAEEAFSLDDVGIEMGAEDITVQEAGPEVAAVPEESLEFSEEGFELTEEPLGLPAADTAAAGSHETADMADADRFVAEGRFAEAMEIYRKALVSDPDDKIVRQRVEELRQLLKLLGKDSEVLIARLNTFLEGINKRRDEFFGRS